MLITNGRVQTVDQWEYLMRNEEVVQMWLWGDTGRAGNLWTDGVKLYSYNLMIGDRSDCQIRIFDYTASGQYVSQTTSCHVGLAMREADGTFFLMPPVAHRTATCV
jgi:hypothetical protein